MQIACKKEITIINASDAGTSRMFPRLKIFFTFSFLRGHCWRMAGILQNCDICWDKIRGNMFFFLNTFYNIYNYAWTCVIFVDCFTVFSLIVLLSTVVCFLSHTYFIFRYNSFSRYVLTLWRRQTKAKLLQLVHRDTLSSELFEFLRYLYPF